MGDIQVLLREIFAATDEYERAERYSRGKVSEVWSNKRVARIMARSAKNYRVNIARRPIDAVLDRLEIMSVAVAGPDGDDESATRVLMEKIWDANKLDLMLPGAFDKAETYGDAYLICWPGRDDGTVDVRVNDPKSVRVIYDPEDSLRVAFSGRTWLDSDGYRRVTLWYDGPARERWRAKVPEKDGAPVGGYKDEDFEPFMDDPDDPDSWREDLAMGLGNPVFHLRNADVDGYGVPEHENVYGTQNMLTKQVATMMEATDGYGFPFRYALVKAGTTGNVASTMDHDDDWDDDEGGFSPGSEPSAPKAQKVNPGELAKMWDTDSVGQLEPAQVSNFLDPISMTLRLSSVVSNTPLNYFDPSAASASGESKKEHEKPAVNKANNRLKWFDATLRDAFPYAMAMLGAPGLTVSIAWAPTETVDDQAEVTLAKSRQDAGVPLHRTLVDLGYADKDVQQWIEDATSDDEVLAHRVSLLQGLAQAARDLGTAATLGVIDETQVSVLIARIISGDQQGKVTVPPPTDPPAPEPTPNEGIPVG